MKRIFTLLAILAVVASTLIAAEPKLLKFDGPLIPVDQPAKKGLSLKASAPTHTEAPAVAYASMEVPDPSEWDVVEGTWFYYSGYTGKSYPTEVRCFYPTDDYAYIYLTNDLFGSVRLGTNLVTGDTNFLYDYKSDEYGNQEAVYPELKGENGESLGEVLISTNADTYVPSYGNWAVYPLAGNARILVQTIKKYDDGEYDWNTRKPYYDYLYNTQAKDCKIKAEYARSYYNGEKTAKIKLTKGADVTDIYYIMTMQYVDDKRTNADPDWTAGQGYSHYSVNRYNVGEYLAEFKAGETNDAYIVGHVDPNATEFEIPLPEDDGLKDMFIVAYSGDQITDMVIDKIEVRSPYRWSDYGTISINQNITWAYDCETFSVIENGDYKVEVNEDGSYFRIVNPFTKSDIPEANYLYLNAKDGRLDKCFIDMSYSPFERTYSFPTPDGTVETFSHPFIIFDYIGVNLINGFYPSDLYKDYDLFIDLESGKVDKHTLIAQDYNSFLYSRQWSSTYVIVSAYGDVDMQFPDYLVATPTGRGISFEAGPDVDYVLCSFDYADSGIMTASADDSDSFRVNIEDGKGQIDILDLRENGKITSLPVGARLTAYKAADTPARTVSVDLSAHIFDNEAMGSVTFTDTYGTGIETFLDKDLMIARKDIGNNYVEYEIKDFATALDLPVVDPDLTLSFKVSGSYLSWPYKLKYLCALKHGTYGTLYVHLGFGNMQYDRSTDDGNDVVSGTIYLLCYEYHLLADDLLNNYNNEYYVGIWDLATINIALPKELTQTNSTSGIEEVVGEDMDEVPPVYYNLQGIQVDNPQPGTLLIERRGNSARKIIFRN